MPDTRDTRSANGPDPDIYRQILESARCYAIFSMDLDGNITTWNTGAEKIMGYAPDEVVGKDASIIYTDPDREHEIPEKEIATALRGECAVNERWHVRKDGSRFWGEGLLMPLLGRFGKTEGFVKIMRERKSPSDGATAP
jgi:PAS domain S-box-containing protein